jgi:type VI secretion system protein ImpL
MKISKQTLTAVLVLIIWLILSWFLGSWLHLKSSQIWFLRIGLAVIGVIGFVAYLLLMRSSRQGAATSTPAGSPGAAQDIDYVFTEASNRLRASNRTKAKTVAGLPAIFILGDSNTAKTSVLAKSGLDPELLAGQAYQDNLVTSTKSVNLWFARDIVFVDPAGRIVADPAARRKLFHKFAPVGFGSVVGGSIPPPRAVVIAFDCETLLAHGSTEMVGGKARQLQAILAELAHELGTSFPVYVLFTKADRIPYFRDYVERLSETEASEVLGATLPLDAASSGVYAEEQTRRLTDAFQSLYHALAEKRTTLLAREHDNAKLPNIYEFPREFGKLRPLIVQFLLDLCRPSQLQTTPFLRGFYFTGVRPVLVRDLVPAAVPQVQAEPVGLDAGATRIFSRGGASMPLADAPQGSSRRVPQWIFLNHLFSDLILGDRSALGITQKNVKVGFWRRALMASAALVALFLAGAWTLSYLRNRSWVDDAEQAARAVPVQQLSSAQALSPDALKQLEHVREKVAELDEYEEHGAPWDLRWGLYSGSRIREPLQRVYYAMFRKLLLAPTQDTLIAVCSNPPKSEDISNYGAVYDALKAYLITTDYQHSLKSYLETTNYQKDKTRDFLSPVLLNHWQASRQLESRSVALGKQQFDFYAEGLVASNPYAHSVVTDESAISTGRKYLNKFDYQQRVYQQMLADVERQNPPIVFNQKFPLAVDVVSNSYKVRGAFTKDGFGAFQKELQDPSKYRPGEEWVLGPNATVPKDLGEIRTQIQQLYTDGFIQAWREYLRKTEFRAYRNLDDATKKLDKVIGNQSPILAVLCLASDNTSVAQQSIADLFKAPHLVTPKGCLDTLQSPSNKDYLNAVTELWKSVSLVAQNPGDAAAAQRTSAAEKDAEGVATQITRNFGAVDRGGVIDNTTRILLAPITGIGPLVGNIGKDEANRGAKQACDALQSMLTKYPFNPHSKEEATIKEVTDMLRQPDGMLWSIYKSTFQKQMVKEGSTYGQAPGASLTLNKDFLRWVNRAAAISDALFKDGQQAPNFTFALRPAPSDDVESVTLEINGQKHKYAKGEGNFQFTWPGAVQDVRVVPTFIGGTTLTLSDLDGAWSVLRWIDGGEHPQRQGDVYTFETVLRTTSGVAKIQSNGHPATVAFVLDPMNSPIRPGFFSGLSPCVSRAVQ